MPAEPVIARAALHMWEEPCISGTNGSGAIFFSGCSLKCVYCQNYKLSHDNFGARVTAENLLKIFDSLIRQGAHNINLVNPTHFAPVIAEALKKYHSKVPVVYNTGGYETVETLKTLEGLIDVYLPDLKYIDGKTSMKYSKADDYFEYASKAILEMSRQVGVPVLDENGIIRKGLIVRHLILPQNINQSLRILDWIKENLPKGTFVSIMSQYTPCGKADEFPELGRRITKREYDKVADRLWALGLTDGYMQELSSAKEEYIPDFNLQGVIRD